MKSKKKKQTKKWIIISVSVIAIILVISLGYDWFKDSGVVRKINYCFDTESSDECKPALQGGSLTDDEYATILNILSCDYDSDCVTVRCYEDSGSSLAINKRYLPLWEFVNGKIEIPETFKCDNVPKCLENTCKTPIGGVHD